MVFQAITLLAILASFGVIAWIIFKNIPRTANAPEYEVEYLSRGKSLWRVLFSFLAKKQKLITKALITKAIRRLKVISLKTDNLASSLLEKIQSRDDTRK